MKIKIDSEFLIGIASFLKRLHQTTTMWNSECSECHKQFGRDGRYNFTKCPTCIGYEIISIVDKQNKGRSSRQPKKEPSAPLLTNPEYVLLQVGQPRATDNGPHQAGTYIQNPVRCYHQPPCGNQEKHAQKKLTDLED